MPDPKLSDIGQGAVLGQSIAQTWIYLVEIHHAEAHGSGPEVTVVVPEEESLEPTGLIVFPEHHVHRIGGACGLSLSGGGGHTYSA